MTEEQKNLICKMKLAIDKNYSFNSKIVTDLYNTIFNKRVSNTNCSTCLRRRIGELYKYYEERNTEQVHS